MLALQWLLSSRLLKMDAPRRWIKSEVAFQAVVLVAAGVYILLMVRRHPAGIAWGAPGAAAVIANALALQVLLFRLMRMLREG